MAEEQQIIVIDRGFNQQQISSRIMVLASLAGIIIGGPFLGMMGFSFIATLTLLLITSPLLIIFSPIFFGAGCIFAFAMAGFAVAAAMAFAGLSSFAWIYKSSRGSRRALGYDTGVTDKLIESSEDFKQYGTNWASYLQQNVRNPQEDMVNRR